MPSAPRTLAIANDCLHAIKRGSGFSRGTTVEVPEEYVGKVAPAYLPRLLSAVETKAGHGFLFADEVSGELFTLTVLPFNG